MTQYALPVYIYVRTHNIAAFIPYLLAFFRAAVAAFFRVAALFRFAAFPLAAAAVPAPFRLLNISISLSSLNLTSLYSYVIRSWQLFKTLGSAEENPGSGSGSQSLT
jgi:hypothetical protein